MRFRTEKGEPIFRVLTTSPGGVFVEINNRVKNHEENYVSSGPKESRCLFHILDHFHVKRAAFLASTAGDTIGRVRVQRQVMLANGRRHLAQAPGQIVILMHGGDVDFLRAGQAVIAVHARAVG